MEASSRGASEGATSTGRGQIGRQTFELAHNLIREGKKPTEAFAIVAREHRPLGGHRRDRVLPRRPDHPWRRRREAAQPPRPPHRTGSGCSDDSRRRRDGAGTTTSELLRQLVDAAAALAQHVERLEKENAEYRKIAAALERLQLAR